MIATITKSRSFDKLCTISVTRPRKHATQSYYSITESSAKRLNKILAQFSWEYSLHQKERSLDESSTWVGKDGMQSYFYIRPMSNKKEQDFTGSKSWEMCQYCGHELKSSSASGTDVYVYCVLCNYEDDW